MKSERAEKIYEIGDLEKIKHILDIKFDSVNYSEEAGDEK